MEMELITYIIEIQTLTPVDQKMRDAIKEHLKASAENIRTGLKLKGYSGAIVEIDLQPTT